HAALFCLCFFYKCSRAHRDLHSFPTRRSSDLVWVQFLKQLGELGYVEGQNIVLERRFAGGRQERLAEFVADLAERRVDVVVATRSEEHTSELQSRFDLVCRLLLEKKNKIFLMD